MKQAGEVVAPVAESRPVGEQERILHYVHVFGGLIPLQVLHVRGPLEAERLKRALTELQRRHAILRAHIRYGRPKFLSVPPFVYLQPYFDTRGTTEIPLRIVTARWQDELSRELTKHMGLGRKPRLRFTLVRDPADASLNHIIFAADHSILDGQAANLISRELLEWLGDNRAFEAVGPSDRELPPPLEAGLPVKPNSGNKGYEPIFRLPVQRHHRAKRETRVVVRRIDAEATKALKAAVKINRTTLHGAMAAAFLMAMRERYGITAMTCLSSVDLRRLCRPPLPADTCGCYIDILRTKHALAGDFWSVARDVSYKLVSTLAKDQASASVLNQPGWEVYRAEWKSTFGSRRRIDGLGLTTAGESGLRSHYGELTLEGVAAAVSLNLFGPGLMVIANERGGGVDVCVCYAAEALPETDALWMTDRAVASLGINSELLGAA
jgi:hypothetical protein